MPNIRVFYDGGCPLCQKEISIYQRADGQLVSGARGFIEVWQQLPGWKWLAKFAVIPGVPGIMEGMYRAFLKIRPGLQRWVRKVSG